MFISPKTAIAEGWITHPKCQSVEDWTTRKFLNPNAIDFTLDRVYNIREDNAFIIDEDNKMMRGVDERLPVADRATQKMHWNLLGNSNTGPWETLEISSQ